MADQMRAMVLENLSNMNVQLLCDQLTLEIELEGNESHLGLIQDHIHDEVNEKYTRLMAMNLLMLRSSYDVFKRNLGTFFGALAFEIGKLQTKEEDAKYRAEITTIFTQIQAGFTQINSRIAALETELAALNRFREEYFSQLEQRIQRLETTQQPQPANLSTGVFQLDVTKLENFNEQQQLNDVRKGHINDIKTLLSRINILSARISDSSGYPALTYDTDNLGDDRLSDIIKNLKETLARYTREDERIRSSSKYYAAKDANKAAYPPERLPNTRFLDDFEGPEDNDVIIDEVSDIEMSLSSGDESINFSGK